MCGRYTLSVPLSNLVDAFEVGPPDFDYLPRFNIAPTQTAPIVAQDSKGRRMGLLRWGLVPSWAKDLAIGSRMINARAETVAEKPAFRSAFRKRRCVIPADGFFEWKKDEGGEGKGGAKTPYWIHFPRQRVFAMAGLWEVWRPANSDPVYTFTILTAEAIPSIREIHHRMPVILDPDGVDRWLDPGSEASDLTPLLGPMAEGIQAFPVGTQVNSPKNDGPGCIEPA